MERTIITCHELRQFQISDELGSVYKYSRAHFLSNTYILIFITHDAEQ